jgi:hypothetical protein
MPFIKLISIDRPPSVTFDIYVSSATQLIPNHQLTFLEDR